MLLFKPCHIRPIIDGVKTHTRRNWKSRRVNIGSTQLAKTKMLSRDYFAKLSIMDVWQEPLGDITAESAYKEGGYTVEEYIALWDEINGPGSWKDDLEIWVVDMRCIEVNPLFSSTTTIPQLDIVL